MPEPESDFRRRGKFLGGVVGRTGAIIAALHEVCPLVWCLTNTVMKMRGHFGCRQGAMTCRGDRRSPPWWRAPREEDAGSSPE